jgi:hypothetical protein
MNQRFLMWGLTSIAFVVALAISSWNEGLWVSDETPPTQHGVRSASFVADETPTPLPARPFAPLRTAQSTPAETVVAAAPPPAPAPQEQEAPAQEEAPPPPMPTAEQEMDTTEFLDHRDRASQHGSRAR